MLKSTSSSSVNTNRIVIVGAGVSGLTCARNLTKMLNRTSYMITIFEARDRIGGRTASIPELNLDLGASWIFPDHNAVHSLASELGIKTIDQYETGTSLLDMNDGKTIQRKILSRIHGGVLRLQGGTASLCNNMFDELMSKHQSTVTVKLNSPVSAIDFNENTNIIDVRLQDNTTVAADYVVLALPPKLLIVTIKFTPALPTTLGKKLNDCVTWMASTCKAILIYESAWWRDLKLSGFAVSRQLKVFEWHDASSETCNALFAFCLPGTSKQDVIDATARVFGDQANHPTVIHMIDWSTEKFTSSSVSDGRGGHPHLTDSAREPLWNGHLWLGNSEIDESEGGFIEGAVRRGIQVAKHISARIMAH